MTSTCRQSLSRQRRRRLVHLRQLLYSSSSFASASGRSRTLDLGSGVVDVSSDFRLVLLTRERRCRQYPLDDLLASLCTIVDFSLDPTTVAQLVRLRLIASLAAADSNELLEICRKREQTTGECDDDDVNEDNNDRLIVSS